MKILVTGASGLVGTKLVPELKAIGHQVLKLSRKPAGKPDEVCWDPEQGFSPDEISKLNNIDGVIHLAGESVADGNWSEEKKRRIEDSRVVGTRTLIKALKGLEKPPRIFVSASAIGFYGDRGGEVLTEDSKAGEGFLPEVCLKWEAEANNAKEFGARVVTPRIGIILSKSGGALAKMLTPFSYGVGGVIGSGEQFMSWIAVDDLVRLLIYIVNNDSIEGVVNATAPNPVTNREFTKVLGAAVNRPTILPVPEFGIKLLFGEMGESLILEGAKVLPKKLEETGFEFKFAKLEDAIRSALDE